MPINTPATNENENNEEFKTLPPDLQKNVDDFKNQINEIQQSTSKVNLSPQKLKKMYDEKRQKSPTYSQYGDDSDIQVLLTMTKNGYHGFVIEKINSIVKELDGQIQNNPNSDNQEMGLQDTAPKEDVSLSIRKLGNMKKLIEEIMKKYERIERELQEQEKKIAALLKKDLTSIINDDCGNTLNYLYLVQNIANGEHAYIQNLAQAGQQMYGAHQQAYQAILAKQKEATDLFQEIESMINKKRPYV